MVDAKHRFLLLGSSSASACCPKPLSAFTANLLVRLLGWGVGGRELQLYSVRDPQEPMLNLFLCPPFSRKFITKGTGRKKHRQPLPEYYILPVVAGRSVLVWGASLCYLEWLFPALGRREELVFDFSSCTSTALELISLVLLPWRQASS